MREVTTIEHALAMLSRLDWAWQQRYDRLEREAHRLAAERFDRIAEEAASRLANEEDPF